MDKHAEQEILRQVDEIVARGPFAPTWESLTKAQTPNWFREKRLGIFIHWGLYSVPANSNEWYSRNMYIKGTPAYEHHRKTYGTQDRFGYKDFIPLFGAEDFEPKQWIDLFREAGAGYIFPVAEHHDGFQMYDSALSDWNSVKMGPGRDILGELREEAQRQGLVFCTSSHRAEHWWFMSHGREFDSDVKEPMEKGDFYWPAMPEPDHQALQSEPYPTREFLEDWLARTAEIVLRYRPRLLYFDWWIQHEAFKPYLRKLAAFYYNCGKLWGQDVMICYKHDAMMFGAGIVQVERGGFADAKPYAWQTDTAVARNSWCYTDTLDYKSSREVIWTLIDAVSKGGNLLLNVGPKADGTIPQGDRRILEDLGKWMSVNAQAIHGSRCWRTSQEGPTVVAQGQFSDSVAPTYTSDDYRFTVGNGAIYAICMVCPEDGCFTIRSLADSPDQNIPQFHGLVDKVEILGYSGAVDWKKDGAGLHVRAAVRSDMPVVIKVTVK